MIYGSDRGGDKPSGLKFSGIRPLSHIADQAKALAFKSQLYDLTLMGASPENLHIIPTDPWPGRIDVAQDIMLGRFTFVGETVEMDRVNWLPESTSQDWRAEFHRFDWLRDLRAAGTDTARMTARHMVLDWIDHFERWDALVWRPDVLGARLSNWIGAFSFFGLSADEAAQAKIRLSISKQTRHLARVITNGEVSTVQSMAALKGLIYALIAIGSPKKQLENPFKRVIEHINAHILTDGGHISRSPHVLAQILMILIDLRNVLNMAKLDVPQDLQHAIDKMVPALKFFRQADGGLATFNGAYEGNASLLDTILNLSGARGRPLKRLEHSGYTKLRQGRGVLIVDDGRIEDLHHTRTMHAAPLSFEFAFGRERILTNCGAASEYGPWFEALRGTSAHTALTLDNRNALAIDEVTKRFKSKAPSQAIVHSEGNMCLYEGVHEGYMPRYGTRHARRLEMRECGNILVGEDRLTGGGAGTPFSIRFHLHPTSQASLIQQGAEVLIQTKSRTGWRLCCEGDVTLSLEDSVHIGRRQTQRRTQQVIISGRTSGGETLVKWGLSRILA